MEILIFLAVLGAVGFLIYKLTSSEDVDVIEPTQQTLPPGSAPIVRRDTQQSTYQSSSQQQDYDDGFTTSLLVAAATDNAMLGVLAGGNLSGALIGDALNNSDDNFPQAPSEDNSSCTDDNSSENCDSSSDSSSDYSSDSSSDSSSYDSGSSDSGSFDSGGSFGD
jgi:hypothetical protein